MAYNSEYNKAYYQKNKEKYKQKAKAWTANNRNYHRKLTVRYKLLVGCNLCGYKKCDKALEFHHKGQAGKSFNISTVLFNGVSTAKLKNEIRKCIVVCANCHREIHAGEVSKAQKSTLS